MISTQNGIIALPEICINGTYGAICDSGWDDRDARVACRQLGFSFFNSKLLVCLKILEHLKIMTISFRCQSSL